MEIVPRDADIEAQVFSKNTTVGEFLSIKIDLWNSLIVILFLYWHRIFEITTIKMYREKIKELQQLHRENSQILFKLERDLARVKGAQVNPDYKIETN